MYGRRAEGGSAGTTVVVPNRKSSPTRLTTLGLAVLLGLVALFVIGFATRANAADAIARISASVETAPVSHSGDAADDPAIWVNPQNAAQSTVIGTDKKGGLAVYDLAGRQIQYVNAGAVNNVDLRDGFNLGGKEVTLVTASNQANKAIGIYKVDPTTCKLVNVSASVTTTLDNNYGLCMYHNRATDKYYVFVNSESEPGQNPGEVEQWELFDNGAGKVGGRKVRTFDVGSQTEGCVADDQQQLFYIGEEEKGIWKYGAEPGAGTKRTLVDATGSRGHLAADVEGLTMAYGANGAGYLIASSQGNSSYVVYKRGSGNDYVKTFKIGSGNGIDGAEGTDGIDVAATNLGTNFPYGVFVAQDGRNDRGNQNFKLVPYQGIL